jgi:multicomponent Na+:H+ antiporter subunit D
MVELGIYAVARIYWVVFSGVLGGFEDPISHVLLGVGAVAAIVGAVMCALQRHLKRLLAYSTVSHAGCFLMGVALLSPDGLAGAALSTLAHAFAKGSLFLAGGILLVAKGEVDELLLYGRGRDLTYARAAWLIAGVALASPPFLGIYPGHALIDDAASHAGDRWVPPVLALATMVSTGAILRAGARVFLGVGAREDPLLTEEPRESPAARDSPSLRLMQVVTLLLAVAGLLAGALPALAARVMEAAHAFTDRAGYTAVVLARGHAAAVAPVHWRTTTESLGWALVTLVGSFALGGLTLYRDRLPRRAQRALARGVEPLRALHTGHIGDYVAWLTFGVAVVGGLFALTIR